MFNQPLKTTKTKYFKDYGYYFEIYPSLICVHGYDLNSDDSFKMKFMFHSKQEMIEKTKNEIISRKKKIQ